MSGVKLPHFTVVLFSTRQNTSPERLSAVKLNFVTIS